MNNNLENDGDHKIDEIQQEVDTLKRDILTLLGNISELKDIEQILISDIKFIKNSNQSE
jgi:hypothetical protein